jgi:hypothetical protein
VENIYFNMLLLLFQNKLFFSVRVTFSCEDGCTETLCLIWVKGNFFLVHLDREKYMFFLCGWFFFPVRVRVFSVRLFLFFCVDIHIEKIIFNLGECNFSMGGGPTGKQFLTVNSQKKIDFSVCYILMVYHQKNIFL